MTYDMTVNLPANWVNRATQSDTVRFMTRDSWKSVHARTVTDLPYALNKCNAVIIAFKAHESQYTA
jgi:hypothetical protein